MFTFTYTFTGYTDLLGDSANRHVSKETLPALVGSDLVVGEIQRPFREGLFEDVDDGRR